MAILKLQGAAERQAGIYYEVDSTSEPLGRGGMGTVLPALRIDSAGQKRPAAVKFLFSDLPATVIARARQEASIQIKSDNLVEMFGFVQVDQQNANGQIVSRYHVASELLQGVMLFDLLRGVTCDKFGYPIAYAQELVTLMQTDRQKFALIVTKNILSGIMALHDAGYVHRDIDPSNIMITSDRKIKLLDFGIVKNLNDQSPQLSMTGQFLGKASYAAPEIVNGLVHDQNISTDIYSVGIMLFELLTGHLPFTGTTNEIISQQKSAPLPIAEIKNPSMVMMLQKATAKNQSARYQSATEMRVDVEHILSGVPITKSTESQQPSSDRSISMPVWLKWLLLAIAGLGVGAVLGFLV